MSENDKVNTGHNIENKELIVNARKPVGELGHQILDRMNKSHENMAQWGVSHFDIKEDDLILDIGCGGGRKPRHRYRWRSSKGCGPGSCSGRCKIRCPGRSPSR